MPLLVLGTIFLFIFASRHTWGHAPGIVKYVQRLGGKAYCAPSINAQGMRGLYATKDIKEGEVILRIPHSSLVFFESNLLMMQVHDLLRIMKSPNSPFQPYVANLPTPNEVRCVFNLPKEYVGMLENKQLETYVLSTQRLLKGFYESKDPAVYGVSLREDPITAGATWEEVQYAAALVLTRRHVYDEASGLHALVPLFDLANHRRGCLHRLDFHAHPGHVDFIAGANIALGEEVCYQYGDMRDDFALTRYGFLPEPEDPPRLSEVDHHQYQSYPYFAILTEERFNGTSRHQSMKEIHRLSKILDHLLAADNQTYEGPDSWLDRSWFTLLKEFQSRRRQALTWEIQRLELSIA